MLMQLNSRLHGWAKAPHSSMSVRERERKRERDEDEERQKKKEDPKALRQGMRDQRAAL